MTQANPHLFPPVVLPHFLCFILTVQLLSLSHACETNNGRVPLTLRVYLLNVVAYEIPTSNYFSDLPSKHAVRTPLSL